MTQGFVCLYECGPPGFQSATPPTPRIARPAQFFEYVIRSG